MNRREILGASAALTAAAFAAPVWAADIDRFTVETRGKGPDVILIPGLSSSREIWEPTAKALEGRYRVHLVQVAGFAGAPTGANAEGKVAAGVAEGLAVYIQSKGLKKPAVIAKLRDNGYEVVAHGSEALSKYLKSEVPRWHDIIAKAGIKPV